MTVDRNHSHQALHPGAGHPIAENLAAASALGAPLVPLCPRAAQSFAPSCAELESYLTEAEGQIYLLIDTALGGAILADFATDGLVGLPLFPPESDPALLEVAPVMVPCPDVPTVMARFHAFWGRGMASIVVSQSPADVLYEHLRKTLYVEAPGGDIWILRFHDPRVLNRLSEVLSDDQIDEVFGDIIDQFLFEGADGSVAQLTALEEDVA